MTKEEEILFFRITDAFTEELINEHIELFKAINQENYENAALIRDTLKIICLEASIELNNKCGIPLKKSIKHCKEQSQLCLDSFTKNNEKIKII